MGSVFVFLTARHTFRVYTSGNEGPVVLFIHGGGFSALTWAVLAVSINKFQESMSTRSEVIEIQNVTDWEIWEAI